MGMLRFAVCVSGVYGTFLLWAIAQERLVSRPFPSTSHPARLQPPTSNSSLSSQADKFPSPLFLNYVQSLASALSSLTYLVFQSYRSGTWTSRTWAQILGVDFMRRSPVENERAEATKRGIKLSEGNGRDVNGTSHSGMQKGDGNGVVDLTEGTVSMKRDKEAAGFSTWRKSLPALLLQVSVLQTIAGPVGFLALRHISYPTMVLGKSCKLIPVLLLNVLLYRRRFSSHKYLVVGLVTLGISLFMLLGNASAGKKGKGGSDSSLGLLFLALNLFIDGLTNSTQDQIFTLHPKFTGQQMMFAMSLLTQLLLLPFILLPFPLHPLTLLNHLHLPFLPTSDPALQSPILLSPPAALRSLQFLYTHPSALAPLLQYAILGGLGQLFIFETIQHFGSLTLVMVTVTRKLFTMLLSVVVFEHRLSWGQWVGVGVVFAGIGVEAGHKRREVIKRTRRD